MKETYTAQDSAFIASSASSPHEKRTANPLVLQDSPEEDDEPPIRPTTNRRNSINDRNSKSASEKVPPSLGTTTTFIVEKRPFDRNRIELAQYLHTSLGSGLDDSEAQNRLKSHGKNILKGQGKVTVWAVLWRQVSNAMTVILLGALAIAFATEDYAEGGVIAGITPRFDPANFSYCRR
jgi:magnesium-transporting ATPase (P-type)